MKHITIGILAHVDAGKTTLSECMLYLSGRIRKLGRVDHKDAFLDTYELERERGITIFSKQAELETGNLGITLLDTPGHVDFSAEMERTLQVLDYAILVINGADGVQGHTRTLWGLLKRYQIPTFLFINKMDQVGTDKEKVLDDLQNRLDEACIDFTERSEEFFDSLAMCDEEAMEEYLESEKVEEDTIAEMIGMRKVYPCYFGSALKIEGVQEFMDGMADYIEKNEQWTEKGEHGKTEAYRKSDQKTGRKDSGALNEKDISEFGAKVYKISRDSSGSRLTHLKVTSGVLKVKDILNGYAGKKSSMNESDTSEVSEKSTLGKEADRWEEKVNQIRIYSGEKYEMVQEAEAGMICAVTGLNYTYPGEGLGIEADSEAPALEPVLSYKIELPEGCDVHKMLGNLRILEEEDPMLKIVWNEELGEIHAKLMGAVQIEILKSLIKDRFGVEVEFDTGNIVYKETIQNTVEGVGHFEPLRHYAEVHLKMEPGERGSGIVIGTDCSEDMLDKNWQRLILTHLLEKEHRGVLTGSVITDMKITLTAGRAHLKHTEGGDFRQATYRAVRQGLMQAESLLLEPYYDFQLEVPSGMIGRALTDIQRMNGEAGTPQTEGEMTTIEGYAPVAAMRDYQMEVNAYTRGQGHLTCTFRGYEPCRNAEEVIENIAYDPERDTENPTGSVFCSHGAGFNVSWDKVPEYMHLENQLEKERALEEAKRQSRQIERQAPRAARTPKVYSKAEEKELEEIFIRTYGKVERKGGLTPQTYESEYAKKQRKKEEAVQEYLLVDGYNVIFAWEELKELAKVSIEAARDKLMDILCNYQGYKKCVLILVFDAYKVEGYTLEIQKYHNIHVVYTKEAETADQYIEKVVHHIGRKYHVTVVTSDGVEQVITMGQGGTRISSRDFLEEIEYTKKLIAEDNEKQRVSDRNYLFDHADEEFVRKMEDIRLGRKSKQSGEP
nr:TetM/TetW/TetO/TetS family tetracycline resistance ribosomal protection protein [uncultured Dorea sp.]